jgi:hypothetical protein
VSRALRRLETEHVIEKLPSGVFRVLSNEVPRLGFNRAWSNPTGTFSPDKIILMTLASPSYRDVARLCREFGIKRVEKGLEYLCQVGEIGQDQFVVWSGRIGNIRSGFDAVARQAAG